MVHFSDLLLLSLPFQLSQNQIFFLLLYRVLHGVEILLNELKISLNFIEARFENLFHFHYILGEVLGEIGFHQTAIFHIILHTDL